VQPGHIVFGVLFVVIAVVTLWLLARLSGSDDRRRRCDRRWMLFVDLCRAHGLPWSDWWLLYRVARHDRLREPARIFLEPERLEAATLSPSLQSRADRLRWLRERLFARSRQSGEQPGGKPGAGRERQPVEPSAIASDSTAAEGAAADEAIEPAPAFPITARPALDIPPWVLPDDSAVERPTTDAP
jgi:hypothetical protein